MHYTKKILILTDSLAFPRSEPEYVSYGETYISLLKESYPHIDFIHYGHGGSTIVNLYEYSKYFHNFSCNYSLDGIYKLAFDL